MCYLIRTILLCSSIIHQRPPVSIAVVSSFLITHTTTTLTTTSLRYRNHIVTPAVYFQQLYQPQQQRYYTRMSSSLEPNPTTTSSLTTTGSEDDKETYDNWDSMKDVAIQQCIIPLSYQLHKGSCGRIAIIGGSDEYTGAPYYTAMGALRSGCDLVSIYTAKEACVPLKCYSPELMIQWSLLDTSYEIRLIVDPFIDSIKQKGIHCVIIGPGMGRSERVYDIIKRILWRIRSELKHIYVILDADALHMLSLYYYDNVLEGYEKAIITPNQIEYERLFKKDEETVREDGDDCTSTPIDFLHEATIVQKGYMDKIWLNNTIQYTCGEMGGMKRCGGIGDVLAGVIGTIVTGQSLKLTSNSSSSTNSPVSNGTVNVPLACYVACCIVKRATKRAFDMKHRSMNANDIIDQIGPCMDDMINMQEGFDQQPMEN